MLVRVTTKTLEGTKGLLFASTANQPPRRLGSEEEEDQEGGLEGVSACEYAFSKGEN